MADVESPYSAQWPFHRRQVTRALSHRIVTPATMSPRTPFRDGVAILSTPFYGTFPPAFVPSLKVLCKFLLYILFVYVRRKIFQVV